jgi:uncharacterized protein YqeY
MSETLLDQIARDLKVAMKARKEAEVRTLRGLRAALQSKELEKGRGTMSEEEALVVVQKQARQRRDAMEQFKSAGRQDLYDKELEELGIIQMYLPEELTDAELESIIREAIASTQASSPADMGKVMGFVMPKVKGRADGNRVREIVSQSLQS